MKLINYLSPLTSTKKIGYKQFTESFNQSPNIKGRIAKLSTISTCRYDPVAPKTSNLETFLKRPIKYCFSIVSKKNTEISYSMHTCYYDKKEDAIEAHSKHKIELYDQLTTPYLKQLKANRRLSLHDKDMLFKIFDDMDKLNEIE